MMRERELKIKKRNSGFVSGERTMGIGNSPVDHAGKFPAIRKNNDFIDWLDKIHGLHHDLWGQRSV